MSGKVSHPNSPVNISSTSCWNWQERNIKRFTWPALLRMNNNEQRYSMSWCHHETSALYFCRFRDLWLTNANVIYDNTIICHVKPVTKAGISYSRPERSLVGCRIHADGKVIKHPTDLLRPWCGYSLLRSRIIVFLNKAVLYFNLIPHSAYFSIWIF